VPEEGGIPSPPSRSEHSKVTQSDIDSMSVELLHEVLPFAWVSRLHGTEQFQLTHSPGHAGLDSFHFGTVGESTTVIIDRPNRSIDRQWKKEIIAVQVRKNLSIASYMPLSGSLAQRNGYGARYSRGRSNVPSVDPPSTTMCSIGRYVCLAIDARQAPIVSTRLRTGLMILTSGSPICSFPPTVECESASTSKTSAT
jgi:hypothetical protein